MNLGIKRSSTAGFLALLVFFTLFGAVKPAQAGSTIQVNDFADRYHDPDYCSLRDAIESANKNSKVGGCTAGTGTDTISLEAGNYQVSDPLHGELYINSNLTIVGKGNQGTQGTYIVADLNLGDRVMHIDPTLKGITVKLSNLAITGGDKSDGDGGGILNGHEDLAADSDDRANLTLENVVVYGNQAGSNTV
ncbi:MAG: hypothetical protein EHM21_18165, partial [Chloroflexi bacterium]